MHGAPVGQMQPEFSFAPGARLGLGPHYLVDVGRSGREVLLQQSRGEYLLVDGSGSLIRTLRSDDSIRRCAVSEAALISFSAGPAGGALAGGAGAGAHETRTSQARNAAGRRIAKA